MSFVEIHRSLGMVRSLRYIVAAVAGIGLVVGVASAALAEIKVQPSTPTEDDEIGVSVSVPCKSLMGRRVIDPGQRIIVVVVKAKECGGDAVEMSQKVGKLAPGEYDLRVKVEGDRESFEHVLLTVRPTGAK